jgi:hypothetical protein
MIVERIPLKIQEVFFGTRFLRRVFGGAGLNSW